MVNKDISVLLSKLIISGCNIVISGKGGSGKTTLMRTLINRIPQNLSITSCEETAELFSTHPNIIQREILSNRNDDKNITLSNLMTHSLVMSNDCIVVGELKGEEALLFFDSVSTGHRGYATVHSDSSLNTVDRLVTLMKRDNRAQMYTDTYLTKLLAQSIDVVIYMENFKVQEITEINYNSELQEVQYNPLYVFDVEKYENGKSIGTFKKKNSPKWKAKKKLELSKMEIEKVI
jgi:pilus assembly protein CpaF